MQAELAVLSDARPRNLYLFGLFVADHQLPEPEPLPAPPEPVAVPEPSELAALAAVPNAVHLPALASSTGAPPASTAAMTMPVPHEQSAAASTAVPPDQQASARPSPPPPLPPPASASDGVSAAAASLAVPSSDASMAAAVAQQPSSAAAQQPGSGLAEPDATQMGPEGPLLGSPAFPNVPPPPADRQLRTGHGGTPASAATEEHFELAAVADPARRPPRWTGSDRSTPERGAVLSSSSKQAQANPTDRQMTRWGKEPPSPLKPQNNWKGRLVDNAAAEDTVFSVRPAQHGGLTSLESTPAPSPVAQKLPAEPMAGMTAQRAEVKLETAAPSGDAADAGSLQIPAPAVSAVDNLKAASGTAPEESEQTSDWEAALVSGKAPWRSAAEAAAPEAEAASARQAPTAAASAGGADLTSEKPRRRPDPARASHEGRSRDELRTPRSHDWRMDEPRRQPSEQRTDATRDRQSPGRRTDQARKRRRSTEGRRDDRSRPRSRSRSSDRHNGRRGRERGEDCRERDKRRDKSRDRQVSSCGRPDPSNRRRGSDRWGPSRASQSGRDGHASREQAPSLPPTPSSTAPAASMANMLMLTTEPAERARLLASVLGQVQRSGKHSPAAHAAAASEEGDDLELPPLPDSPLLLQGLPAQAEGATKVASEPEPGATVAAEATSHVQDVVGNVSVADPCTPAAEDVGAEPPLLPGAGTATTREQPDSLAAGDEVLLSGSGSPHAPVMYAAPAQDGEAAIHGQHVNRIHQPTKSDGGNRRRRWEDVEPASLHDDGGQAKRQREASHSKGKDRASASEGSPCAQQQHSQAYEAAYSHLEQGYNPLRTQAGLGPARQRPSYDPFSRQSRSPPPQPASEEPRPLSESLLPLPVESAGDGMPSPDYRLPPPSGDYTAWCAVKDEPGLPSYNPYGSPSPRSSTEGVEQPRNSLGIPYGGEASPAIEPPPPPPPTESPLHQEERPLHRSESLQDRPNRHASLRGSAVHAPLLSQPGRPSLIPSPTSPALWTQHGDYVRPLAQPGDLSCSPVSPAVVELEAAGEQTPPPPPPPPELRHMPPLGSAQKAQQAAQTHADAKAEPAEHAAARSSEGAPPAAGLYVATERARALLASGIDPLRWHGQADTPFVRSIRTRLCQAGNACTKRLTNCAYAHGPRELLTRDDNLLLVEVAREWHSHGVPAEWKHVVRQPTASHADPPAARTVVVAQRRGKDVSPMPLPRRSDSVRPKAPLAARPQLDLRRCDGRRSASARPQQLPHSMLNEDLEIEDSLMHLITVRLSWSTSTCTLVWSHAHSATTCLNRNSP